MLHAFKDRFPKIAKSVFVADSADVIGDVEIGENSSVWFNAVIRGDRNRIVIGERTSIQDCVVIHTDVSHEAKVGRDVTIGHSAVVHGCTIGDYALIGMNSTVLEGTEVGSFSIIGAGAVIPPDTKIPEKSLVLGVPGKVVRTVTEQEIARIKAGAQVYVDLGLQYR